MESLEEIFETGQEDFSMVMTEQPPRSDKPGREAHTIEFKRQYQPLR
jgi:hypothetical protein